MTTPKYEKMDPIDHIHKRSDMYVGSIHQKEEQDEWVMGETSMIKKDTIRYSQAMLRIFVEALSNAIDNVWRSSNTKTPCTKIKVDIDEDKITIWNNGLSIPINKNNNEGVYNPELIFGHLLTGSNYNDNEERFGSGRNGLGIKLTNVFSSEFNVKIYDPDTCILYKKQWTNNMRKNSKEKIHKSSSPNTKDKKGFVEISWRTDFTKFKINRFTKDMLALFKRYVYDTAMLTNVNVYWNGNKVPVKNITQYSKLYSDSECICLKSKSCEVIFTTSSGIEFEHIAFTNGVFNKDGGIHVDRWVNAIFKPLLSKLNKPKKPALTLKDIKKYFRIFIKCNVPNPEFSSQSKTCLTAPDIDTLVENKHIQSILKWEIMSDIQDIIKSKEFLVLKKTEKKTKTFKKIDGYDPANNAGKSSSSECSLILCEGLSAKTYAVDGISVGVNGKQGRDWFGIYPLRGKLLNVKNATISTISKNKEITDIIHTLNLQYDVDYTKDTHFNKLNYGRILILTDSDVDGIHICALIINVFHTLFPTLLQRTPPFIVNMMTPIAKVFTSPPTLFYNENDYIDFCNSTTTKYKTKYYKGLGTSSNKEIKDTFGKKCIELKHDSTLDTVMNKVFHSRMADHRKDWLRKYDKTKTIEDSTYSQYIDRELIKFSISDCDRSIPNVYDGLKQSQRKILYACLKRKLFSKSMKVAQLAGYVAETTNYHHGEQCLFETITKMGQDFPGSNNIPLLFKDGQFGSRNNGGKDAANARYIFTKLQSIVKLIFPEEDQNLLEYVIDDGDRVEPEYFVPIIPMILVNGCSAGIATGWSCSIPSYNPKDIIQCVRNWIHKIELPKIKPWYNHYTGNIEEYEPRKYMSYGTIKRKTKRTVQITELPILLWTDKFKDYAEVLLENKNIKEIKNYSTPTNVHFVIKENENMDCNLKTLKLSTILTETNMVLFGVDNKLLKYDTTHDIINTFCTKRLELYKKRKVYQLQNYQTQLKSLQIRHSFIQSVVNETFIIYRREEKDIIQNLEKLQYPKKDDSYQYLLNIPIRHFSATVVASLEKDIQNVKLKYDQLYKKKETDIWLEELDQLEKHL